MSTSTRPEPLGALLGPLLRHAEATYGDTAHKVWEVWPQAVGPDVARRATPKHFHQGVLTVVVVSAPWLQQLSMLRGQLLRALDRELGDTVVRDLRFRLGNLHEQPPPPPEPDRSLPPLDPEIEASIAEEVAVIGDPELREAVRRARARAAREAVRAARAGDSLLGNTVYPDRGEPKGA